MLCSCIPPDWCLIWKSPSTSETRTKYGPARPPKPSHPVGRVQTQEKLYKKEALLYARVHLEKKTEVKKKHFKKRNDSVMVEVNRSENDWSHFGDSGLNARINWICARKINVRYFFWLAAEAGNMSKTFKCQLSPWRSFENNWVLRNGKQLCASQMLNRTFCEGKMWGFGAPRKFLPACYL